MSLFHEKDYDRDQCAEYHRCDRRNRDYIKFAHLLLLWALSILLSPLQAIGQSGGCSIATCTAAGASEAQVLAALPSPGNTNSTVVTTIPTSTANWTSQVTYTIPAAVTNLTIQGQSVMTASGTPGTSGYAIAATDNTVIVDNIAGNFGVLQINCSTGTNPLVRITGLTFEPGTGGNKFQGDVLFYCSSTAGSQLRFDHNHIVLVGGPTGWAGRLNGCWTGVGDHNLFDNALVTDTGSVYQDFMNANTCNDSLGFGDGSWGAATGWGTSNFFFWESNYVKGGLFLDADVGGKYVARYNTIQSCSHSSSWVHTHGTEQNGGRVRGFRAAEVYKNYIKPCDSSSVIFGADGGPSINWGNTVDPAHAPAGYAGLGNERNDGQHYQDPAGTTGGSCPGNAGSAFKGPSCWGFCGASTVNPDTGSPNGVGSLWDFTTAGNGYPCLDSIGTGQNRQTLNGVDFPGTRNSSTGTVASPQPYHEPTYFACNSSGNLTVTALGNSVSGRDYYPDALVGCGLTSGLPATCNPGPGGSAGLSPGPGTPSWGDGYFAKDANGGNGGLYVCYATNQWTLANGPYPNGPYTYPHPLVGGGGGGTVATPTLSPLPGAYGSGQIITVATSTAGATLCYTTDGSTPTTDGNGNCTHGTTYSSPFLVSSTSTVKAIGTKTGFTDSSIVSGLYTINGAAAAPTYSPVAGAYGPTQNVAITSTTAGSTICWTNDGSTPTADGNGTCTHGTTYSGPVSVSSSQTLKAIASKATFNDSLVSSATYTINGSAAAPTFSPVGGAYGPTQNVAITSTTASSTICWTNDGSTPTANGAGTCTHGTTYTGPVSVASSQTLKAIASKAAFVDSTVSSAAYTINGTAGTPTFSPVAGSYGPTQNVVISTSTAGATICYTTNGSTPASSSPGVCAPGSTQYVSAVAVSSSLTLKAIATKAAFSDSGVGSAAYTINGPVAAPTFSPVPGIYTSTQNVTISTTTPSSSCFYTTDGSTPTPASTPYTTPVVISSTTTLSAICTKTGFSNSSVTAGTYTIATGCTLGFSPAAGTYTGTQNVTITASGCAAGTQVFYRTDGLPATNIDTLYTAPIAVSSSQTLTAIAVINPTVRDQPQTISTQKKCNAIGSPITFPSGYSCNNGSGGVAGTASNFNFAAGSSNQMFVSTTDSVAFDTSILLIDTPTATDNNIVDQSFRKVYQDSSNCSQTSPNLYKCVDVSETDAESCCDATTHALWQMSVRCSTNVAGSSGNNGFLEGDASSGSEKWDIACVIGAATDLTVNTHWTRGDTGCGGSGCMVLDSIYLNGTKYAFPASCDAGDTNCPNYPMTPQPTYSNFIAGSQDQVYARNVGVAGTSPLTTTRSISFGRVGVDEGTETTGSAAYVIGVANPTISPTPGAYGPTQSVTFADATAGSTICYRTDGTNPSSSPAGTCAAGSTTYTGAISVSVTTTFKVIGTKAGLTDSSVVTGTFTINGAAATPTFSPVAGSYVGGQTVTISCSTPSSTIYYTLDGSTPTTSSTVYTGPLSIGVTTTVKALASAPAFSNSAVGTALYTITPAAPLIKGQGTITLKGTQQ